jgi:PD-(D/E)XK nuclease superfamily
MTREDTPTGRYYYTPDGRERFPSMTTVLGRVLSSTWLDEWKARVGEEEAAKVSGVATTRGSSVHLLAERYVLNEEDYARGAMPFNLVTFSQLRKVLDAHVNRVRGIEMPMFSRILGVAGTTDLVADYDDELSIIDYKTSKRLKKREDIEGYLLQGGGYAGMFGETYGFMPLKVVVVIAVDHEPEAQVFTDSSILALGRLTKLIKKAS